MVLLRVCLALLGGIALGVTREGDWQFPVGLGLLLFLASAYARRVSGPSIAHGLFLAVAAVLSFGAARGSWAAMSLPGGNAYAETGSHDLVCRVSDDPEVRGLRQSYRCLVEEVDGLPITPWQAVVSAPRVENLLFGDRVLVIGEPETPRQPDYAEYLRRRGVTATVYATDASLLAKGPGSVMRWLYSVRRATLAGLQQAVPQPEAAFLSGVALGSTEGMPEAVTEDLRGAGLLHILVVSGANVAFLVGVLIVGLRRTVGWGPSLVAAATLCVGYCLITGGDPPVVRGAVMVLLALGAQAVGRPGHGWTALALAAAAMAAVNPLSVAEPSYQLSVATSGGMLSIQNLQWPSAVRRSRWRPVLEALVATLAAQLAAVPISAVHFGRIPGLGVLSNALVLPLQPAQMLLALVAAVTATVSPPAAQVTALPAWLCARVTLIVAHRAAALPLATLACPLWPVGAVVAYYAGLLGLVAGPRRLPAWVRSASAWRPRRPAALVALLAAVAVVVWAVALQLPDGRLHVAFLDVGQGDAVLVTTPGGNHVLIDGGSDPDRLRAYLGQALPVWNRRLQMVVLTHPDMDHMGGLFGLRPRYSVDVLMQSAAEPPSAWAVDWEALREGAATVVTPAAGQSLHLGDGVLLEVLYPTSAGCPAWGSTDNDCSTVLRLSYGDAAFLLTGDAEGTVESLLLDRDALSPTWVLKVSHHGSRHGTTDAFLAAVRPALAVISVGDNRYGHPAAEVLERLREHGVECLRTDQLGTIEIETDGSRYSVQYH